MMFKKSFLACVLACALLPAQTTVVLNPVHDGTLYQDATGSLANGSGTSFFCGLNNMLQVRRGLVRFDVAAGVPAGSVICSALVRLDMIAGGISSIPISLHRVTSDWGEGASVASGAQGGGGVAAAGDATWIHTFYPSSFWLSAGGDYAGTASATIPVAANATYTWTGLAADVQSMLDQPALDYGWMLKCPETLAGTVKNFATRESASAAVQPRLEITYHAPVGASVVNALGGCPASSFAMSTAGLPALGNGVFGIAFSGGPASGSVSLYLSTGIAASPVVLANGCIVVIDVAGALLYLSAGLSPIGPFPLSPGGSAFLPAPIPPDPCLVGAAAAVQAVASDPSAPAALIVSNGLLLTIGL